MERDPYTMSPREMSREVLSEVAEQDRESQRSLVEAERDAQRLLRERAEIEELAEKQMRKSGAPGLEELRGRHIELGDELNLALMRKDIARVNGERLDREAQAAREANRAGDRARDAERREIARSGLETRIAIRAHERESQIGARDSGRETEDPWTRSGRLTNDFELKRERDGRDDRER